VAVGRVIAVGFAEDAGRVAVGVVGNGAHRGLGAGGEPVGSVVAVAGGGAALDHLLRPVGVRPRGGQAATAARGVEAVAGVPAQ
jgi:hypothetical protein